MADLTIATCSYRQFVDSMGVPVRTTVGAPRWPLPYELAGQWQEVTPRWAWLSLPYDDYRTKYRDHLDALGPERVLAGARSILDRTEHPGPVVALCFEDLSKPGAWCHRTLLAGWLAEHADLHVPELAPTAPAAPKEHTMTVTAQSIREAQARLDRENVPDLTPEQVAKAAVILGLH